MDKDIFQTIISTSTTIHYTAGSDCLILPLASHNELNIHETDSSVLIMAHFDGHPNIYLYFVLSGKLQCSSLLSMVVIMNLICNCEADKQKGRGKGEEMEGGRDNKREGDWRDWIHSPI